MKKAIYYLLDVFTEERFHGNPLAIFPDSRWVPSSLMQPIAAELNLSETVFLYPADQNGTFPMRIFTPTMELPIAGHPIVGTGFYLARELDHPTDGVQLINLAPKLGEVSVEVTFKDNLPVTTQMLFPKPAFGELLENREEIASILGLTASDLLDLPIQIISCGVPYAIVPVKSLELVKKIHFNPNSWHYLAQILDSCFLYAFTPQGETNQGDLHGRMFAPQAGVPEDPATGSANAPLAAYCYRYGLKEGLLVSEQGFEVGRPSFIHIEAKVEQGEISGVSVGGKCIFVGAGELFLD